MTPTRSALFATAAAVLLLAGCSGGDASQEDVKNDVKDQLLANGYGDREFSAEEADEAATCVANALFEPDQFTKEERNEVVSSGDAEPPNEELVARVVDLVEECAAGTVAGPAAPSDTDTDTDTDTEE